jgi:hypothetical protein
MQLEIEKGDTTTRPHGVSALEAYILVQVQVYKLQDITGYKLQFKIVLSFSNI